tara:strand:+ start:46 stop:522 length:477 start_codon:yes stop_codon:yes gene_type:complete
MANSSSSSITFSFDNINNNNGIKKVEYKYTVLSGNETWFTSYNNKIDNSGITETFNKLYKNGDEHILEKVGTSQNKNSWEIKEFLNTKQEKHYIDDYNNNNFNDILIKCLIENINKNYNEVDTKKNNKIRAKSENNLLDIKVEDDNYSLSIKKNDLYN